MAERRRAAGSTALAAVGTHIALVAAGIGTALLTEAGLGIARLVAAGLGIARLAAAGLGTAPLVTAGFGTPLPPPAGTDPAPA